MWTLLVIGATLAMTMKIALDGMSPKQRHGQTGMRLPMHLAKITRRATAWAWSSNEPVHDQDATKG